MPQYVFGSVGTWDIGVLGAVMEGMCNLECWCHVPTRGRSKPPCYLCVVQVCSQSYKSTTAPSAPALSFEEKLEASAPPLQELVAGASVGNLPQYGECSRWRPPVAFEGVADTQSTNTQYTETSRQNTQLSPLQLRLEDDEGAVGGVLGDLGLEISQDFDNGSHTADDPETREEGCLLDKVPSESPNTSGRGTPSGIQSEESHNLYQNEDYAAKGSGISRSDDKDNKHETWDLSAQIRSLVLGVDDGPYHDDSDTHQVSVPQKSGFETRILEGEEAPPSFWDIHRPGDLRPDRHVTSRVGPSRSHLPRDKNKHLRPSQPFFKFNSVMREKEYQKINRIIRRETSSEAARRYIQRAENLPRRRLRHSGRQGTFATPPHTAGPADLPDTPHPREDGET